MNANGMLKALCELGFTASMLTRYKTNTILHVVVSLPTLKRFKTWHCLYFVLLQLNQFLTGTKKEILTIAQIQEEILTIDSGRNFSHINCD